ncbi:MAG TPA: FAD:protein FMN transferase [Opitutaceae bacterium]|nr:FAD:protein FMN transferase [Opitutaceae bacterium]
MPNPSRYTFPAMGSDCVLQLYDGSVEIAAAAEAEVRRIEARYSRYLPDSLLSEINRVAAAGGSITVDSETAELIDCAELLHRMSRGLFDITSGILRRAWNFNSGQTAQQSDLDRILPLVGFEKLRWEAPRLSFPVAGMELDFGGIGKEYAVDRAAEVCAKAGIRHGLADLGGDLCAIGPRPDGSPWAVHIRHPRQTDAFIGVMNLLNGGLATSGDYERFVVVDGRRYSHILNPKTGWPTEGLASVTVIAPSCLAAGGFTTIAMLKGRDGPEWLRLLPHLPSLWMDVDGNVGANVSRDLPLS